MESRPDRARLSLVAGLLAWAAWATPAATGATGSVTQAGEPVSMGGGTSPNPGDPDVPLDWWNVVILVNADSPASLEVLKLYRQFHPRITDEQIIYLDGLPDSAGPGSGPADEILTRTQFETLIAAPTRAHLLAHGLVDDTYIIITTAGMPYRIEDTDPQFADAVKPAGSSASLVVANRGVVNAASVESELAVLFQIDPNLGESARLPIKGRAVNPYQSYKNGIKRWANVRDILGERTTLRWTTAWRISQSPYFEGEFDTGGYTSRNRLMSPASIYLVARLDGPRTNGTYPVFAVREMLKRAAAVSDLNSRYFVGYSPVRAAVALDFSPNGYGLESSPTYNLPWTLEWLNHVDHMIPPDASSFVPPWQYGNHYANAYRWLTGSTPTDPSMSVATIAAGLGGTVYYEATNAIMNQSFLAADAGIIALSTYGRNSGDGRPVNYLTVSGPGGGPLFRCAYGAFFSSFESFNAVTMFTDAATNQGKIADFIRIGGTCALGHSFEPEAYAVVQSDYVVRNMLRDDDGDGVGDMCAAEAAFSGLPYLSWTEVFIGDPLMRLRWGVGGFVDLTPRTGDVDENGYVGFNDVVLVLAAYGRTMGEPAYSVMADVTQDGVVDGDDVTAVLDHYNEVYP